MKDNQRKAMFAKMRKKVANGRRGKNNRNESFRKWLREEKNYDDRIIMALGKPYFIGQLKKEFNKTR